jgi:hypothetical protein
MFKPIHYKTATLPLPDSISRSPLWRRFLVGALALTWFSLSQTVKAQDGDELNGNTAEGGGALHTYIATASAAFDDTAVGNSALFNNTTGTFNTATGAFALQFNTTGSTNTANGNEALGKNTTGNNNTATGSGALFSNTTGSSNTATGFNALVNNTAGDNTATGANALSSNTTGISNTADGASALNSNTIGEDNTATGISALESNTSGNFNTANGASALNSNTTGNDNTADGLNALFFNTSGHDNTGAGLNALLNNTTGSNNIAVGAQAGSKLTTGSNNIDIGANVFGVAGEANHIRIGTTGTQKAAFIAGIHGVAVTGTAVVVSSSGQLGVAPSSERFKDEIKPMDEASEAILALQPVTFRYKHELDPEGIPQFGLVAEQVERVNPDLVARDADGKVNTVRYEAVNAMLLNEFLKAHKKVEELEATVVQQQKDFQETATHQQKQIETLSAGIQKVSAQVEMRHPAPQSVADNQ